MWWRGRGRCEESIACCCGLSEESSEDLLDVWRQPAATALSDHTARVYSASCPTLGTICCPDMLAPTPITQYCHVEVGDMAKKTPSSSLLLSFTFTAFGTFLMVCSVFFLSGCFLLNSRAKYPFSAHEKKFSLISCCWSRCWSEIKFQKMEFDQRRHAYASRLLGHPVDYGFLSC